MKKEDNTPKTREQLFAEKAEKEENPENAAAGDTREDPLKNDGESESAAVPGNDMGADVSSDSSEEDMSSYLFDDSISVEIGDFLSEGLVRNGEDAASGNMNGN